MTNVANYLNPASSTPPGDALASDPVDREAPVSRTVCGLVSRIKGPTRAFAAAASDYALQCVLVRSGKATLVVRGRVFEVEPATILWLPIDRDADASSSVRDVSEDYAGWSALFGRQVVERASRDADTDILLRTVSDGGLVRRLSKLSARRLETQFEQLAGAAPDSERFGVGLEYLLLSAWAEHQKATRISELTDVHPAVEKAAHILRTQPETGSMQELAHVCGASPSWLSRLFRQQVGISLVGYRNQSRIERFFELYGEGHRRNLTQAAYAAGFGSYAQFHRVFKEALGYSPGELKRNQHDRPSPAPRSPHVDV